MHNCMGSDPILEEVLMKFHYQNPKRLFHGILFDVLSVEAEHPKGGKMRRELVDHPGAVVILPFLNKEEILLIRNKRDIVQRTLWELPAGKLEKDEKPEACAARELQEETGYQATKFTPQLNFFTTPGFSNELIYGYVAEDLTHVGQNLDESEEIDVEPTKLSDALQMIKEGTICDAKTICALLHFTTFR